MTGAVLGWPAATVAALLGAALLAGGVAVIGWAHDLTPGESDEERRLQKGPDRGRRRLLLGMGVGAVTVTAGAVAVPAARRVEQATARLRSTSWVAGARIVDSGGVPVRAADIIEGELLTVYPEGATDSVDSQAVLIRELPERFSNDPERPGWVPDGIAVYSKLCTHMACPLGLYQPQTGTLLCPCHQAVFDVLDGGRSLSGPARRALPQLPVRIAADGFLVADGDFSDAVGTGFWGRP